MYNYPSSLNLIQNFIYVPLCFMYIIPVSRLGLFNNSIPNEVTMMSKRPFVISKFLHLYSFLSVCICVFIQLFSLIMTTHHRVKQSPIKIYIYSGSIRLHNLHAPNLLGSLPSRITPHPTPTSSHTYFHVLFQSDKR